MNSRKCKINYLIWETLCDNKTRSCYHKDFTIIGTETVIYRCSVKNVFLEISQNSQENTSAAVSFLINLQALDLQLYWKRDTGTGVFQWILPNF